MSQAPSPGFTKRRIFTATLCACALALPFIYLLAQGFGRDPHAVPFVLENQPAPPFTLKTLSGEEVSLSALRGQPVVLNFWSTRCTACRFEHDLLVDAANYYRGQVHFLGVVFNDEAAKVAQFQARHPRALPYPQLLDPGSLVAMDFGVAGVPESFILNQEGRIVYKQVGAFAADKLQGILTHLLSNPPAQSAGERP